jgi:cytochrome c peroxidase
MRPGRFARATNALAAFRGLVPIAIALGLALASGSRAIAAADAPYTPTELRVLRSLWIGSLPPLPDDPSNAYDTDPRAARLGRALFFDTGFSKSGTLACVTCHPPETSFQDRKPVAVGETPLSRRSMPLLGVAYNTWFFWDGRKDSLWAQAATPIENPNELGLTRDDVAAYVARRHRADYEAIFGALPGEPRAADATTRVFVNVAKSIAAFVRTIVPGPARFDRFVEAVLAGKAPDATAVLTPAEARGLRLFIGRAHCTNCHAGPLFTNGEFHFTRVPLATDDPGRSAAIALVQKDELNCLGPFSDAKRDDCTALRFLDPETRDTLRAFKTPTLRNVAVRAPYMNAGQFATLGEVLRFYREKSHGLKELAHQDLSDAELADLEAFLGTLTGPVQALDGAAPAPPSGS